MQNKYFEAYLSTIPPDEAERLKNRYHTEPHFKQLMDLIPTLTKSESKTVLKALQTE